MKISVDECPSGIVIDAAVALARGWIMSPYDLDREFSPLVWVGQDGLNRYTVQQPGKNTQCHWCPSIYMEQAWELAEELERVSLYMPDTAIWGLYRAEHLPYPPILVQDSINTDGDSANLALIRLYLKAKQVTAVIVPDDLDLKVAVKYVRLVKEGGLSEFLSAIGSKCVPQDGAYHSVVVRWDKATEMRDVFMDGKKLDIQFELPGDTEQGTMWDWVINPTE